MKPGQLELSRALLFVFSLPAILQGFLHAPAQSLLQGIYAKHAAVPLAALGAAVLLTRLFDGVIDPFIGAAADAWRRCTGSYKAFIAVGTAITVVGLWFLFRPPPDPGVFYFAVWYIVASLGWSITEIPYRAWSMRLSSEYVMRTRIQAWLGVGAMVGTFTFYLVPHIAKSMGLSDTTEFNLEALAVAGFIVAVSLPLGNLVTILVVPDGTATEDAGKVPGLRDMWAAVSRNGPLLYLVFMFLASGLAIGMSQGVLYLWIDGYLGLSKQLSGFLLLALPVTLVAIPTWGALCKRFERQSVWAWALALAALSYFAYGFVPPGEGSVPVVAVLSITMAFSVCAAIVIAPAILGDVIDFGRWKFGEDHSGLYFSFFSIAHKAINAVGIAIGFFMLDVFGYDAAASTYSEEDAFAIRLVVAWIPAAALVVTIPFVWRFPITRNRHDEMLKEIEAKAVAAPA